MRLVTATLARKELHGVSLIQDDVPIGKEYQVDLDSIALGQNFNPTEGKSFPVQVIGVFKNDVMVGFLPVELMDFPEGTELPPVPSADDEWPDELPLGAAERKQPIDLPPGMSPELLAALSSSSGMFTDLGEVMGSARFAAQTMVAAYLQQFRPTRVKLISEKTPEKLEVALNEFLDSGVDVAHISERIFRNGYELIKEVRYYTGPIKLPFPGKLPPFISGPIQTVSAPQPPFDDTTENGGAGSSEEEGPNA